MKPLTLHQIQEECSSWKFYYNETEYKATAIQGTWAKKIKIEGLAPDTRDRSKKFHVMWYYEQVEFYDKQDVQRQIQKAAEAMILHDVKECSRFNGKAIFDPHKSPVL